MSESASTVPTIEIDYQRIFKAIMEAPVKSALAREAGTPLVESWVGEFAERDAQSKTVAVELGFHIWIDANTLVIGVQDRIAKDDEDVYGCEWKSAKEPKQNRDGSDSAYWNEHVWLEELTGGPQLAIYALALHEGTYYEKEPGRELASIYNFNVQNPRILVRAAVKSDPPRFWPSDPTKGMFRFPNEIFPSVRAALRVKAEQIRAARRSGAVPWQMVGKHCQNRYNKQMCPLYENWCSQHVYSETNRKTHFDPNDPAYSLALPFVDERKMASPDFVILSASSYQLATECMERYRVVSGLESGEGKESNLALDTGTVLHAGVAEMYRMMKEQQK